MGTFTCDDCGNTYPKAWTDEEAIAEREGDFPGLAAEDIAVVCEDCYQAMQKQAASVGVQWGWPADG